MSRLRTILVMVLVMILSAVAAPVGAAAAGASVDSLRATGLVASADWFAPGPVELGQPNRMVVQAVDGVMVTHTKGARPSTEPLTMQVVVYGTTLLDENGEPYDAEVWAVATSATWSIAADLSTAMVSFSADGIVVAGGEDTPNGVVIPLTVEAQWTATSGPMISKSHGKFTDPGAFTITSDRSVTRQAQATVTLTGPDGTLFDDMATGEISQMLSASVSHMRP